MIRRFATSLARRVLAYYRAAEPSRLNGGWRRTPPTPQSWLLADGRALRARMNDVYRNTAIGRGLTKSIVRRVIPQPIMPMPAIVNAQGDETREAKSLNLGLSRIWDAYWQDRRAFSLDSKTDFATMQRLAMRALLLDGEVFCIRHRRRNRRGFPNLRFQLVSPERLVGFKPDLRSYRDPQREGIDYDDDGRPVRYRFYKSESQMEFEEFRARDVYHLMVPEYIGTDIGEALSAPIGELIYHFGRYFLAEVQGQEAGARLPIVVTSEDGVSPFPLQSETEQGGLPGEVTGSSYEEVEYFARLLLRPGEAAAPFPQTRPGAGFAPFCEKTMKMMAAATGTPYEEMSGDYSGVNYSTSQMSRIVSDESAQEYRDEIEDFALWQWRAFNEECAVAGLIQPTNANEMLMFRAISTRPAMRIVDELKKANADNLDMKARRKTWTQCLAERGLTPRDFLEAERRERELLAEFKAAFDPYAGDEAEAISGVDERREEEDSAFFYHRKPNGVASHAGSN